MIKSIGWVLVMMVCICGCEKNARCKKNDPFHVLMGSNLPVWDHVMTQEDHGNIKMFNAVYDKHKDVLVEKSECLKSSSTQGNIPKIIHFIWIGPKSFPRESVDYVYSWVNKHPKWRVKFWTDRDRPLPHPNMELHIIDESHFEQLYDMYIDSDNYAEKADLLRYEILYQEGGLYIDHDMMCFHSVDHLHHHFDLYCGLEIPHAPILSTSVSVNNNIIGAIPRHPMLQKSIEHVCSRWDAIRQAYPGDDKPSVIYRVAHRSWSCFHDAVCELIGQTGKNDVVLPAAFFNRLDNQQDGGFIAHHHYASTWFSDETKFEKNVRRRLISLSKKNNQILLFNGCIVFINIIFFLVIIFQISKLRRKQ